MKIIRLQIFMSIIGLTSFSCSTTRVLEKNEYLYKGAKVEIDSEKKLNNVPREKYLKEFTSPRPNHKFAGVVPFKLWMYNLAGRNVPEKGFRHWLKFKAGESPVIYRQYYVETSRNELKKVLQNNGFFYHSIETEEKVKKQKIKIHYNITLEPPYTNDTLTYPAISDSITWYLSQHKTESLIKKGDQYKLENLKNERIRLSDVLRNEGFYYFSPEYLYFRVDTFKNERFMKLQLALKEDTPLEATKIYAINNIYLYHDHSMNDTVKKDTIYSGGIHHLFSKEPKVEPEVLQRSVFIHPGDRYNAEAYKATLNKLSNLGVFKFVRIDYRNAEDEEKPKLDVHTYLTSASSKSLRAEVQAVSKSNDFAGPGIKLSYRNRNLLKNATVLLLSINSAFETQLFNTEKSRSSFELGTSLELEIPGLIFPLYDATHLISKKFSPETRLRVGYNYSDRSNFLTTNSFDLRYGYDWQETKTKKHALDLVSVNYVVIKVPDKSDIEDYIHNRDLREKFIFSLRYDYTINNIMIMNKNIHSYFNFSTEFAGNSLALMNSLINDNHSGEEPSRIFGIAYSQYAKLSIDNRQYLSFLNNSRLVGRLFAGIGLPYGNSEFLPYQKQFYIGGTNSLRAFQARSLGPGTYQPADSLISGFNLEQAGDIKLELNLEYRFNIYKYLKGAIFMDAGNVWLAKPDEQIPGGSFDKVSFYKEIALGTGIGLRFDTSFFVLRMDLGFPLRKPYLTENDRWVYKSIRFLDKDWRNENLVFNVAIGYPF